MDLPGNTYKLMITNKEDLMRLVNQVAVNINESIDKLINEKSSTTTEKKKNFNPKRKFLTRSKSCFERSKKNFSNRSSKAKKIYLTKCSLNLIKNSIKGFVNDILI